MEQELNEKQKVAKSLLDRLKSFFSVKKEIKRIRVRADTQSFWVTNPKKIKFWKGLSEKHLNFNMSNKDKSCNAVEIMKVEYK